MDKETPLRIVFGQEIMKLAEAYDYIVCSADTQCCGLDVFSSKYPEREFSIGIAEQNLIGVASGIASCGNKVVVSTYATFATLRAAEQIRTYICNPQLNVLIIGTHSGLQTGREGTSHTAIEDIAILRAMPNMTIIQPSDNISARLLADLALQFKGPLYVRLPFDAVEDIHSLDCEMEIGKAIMVRNYGKEVSLIATGGMLYTTLQAAEILKNEGINAQVLEIHTIKPIDQDAILQTAAETGAVVTIEDHTIFGGLGGAVAELLIENCPVPMKRIGIQDRFIKSGEAKKLYEEHGMTAVDIVKAAKTVILHKKK